MGSSNGINEVVQSALENLNGVNPFSDEYYFKELEKLKFKDIDNGDVCVVHKKIPHGIHQNYLYQNVYEQEEEFPVLFIKDTLFMSLSRMEVESHFMPIMLANGKVGVGGLGLGYYVQSILDKEEVASVTVYEMNQDVIDYYYLNFGLHEKLTIIKEDVFNCKGEYFDFFYMDIYEMACDDDAVTDMKKFTGNNNVDTYHFWTIEAFVQAMIIYKGEDIIYSKPIIKLLLERYISFIVVLEEYGVKPTNYLDGEEIFNQLNY